MVRKETIASEPDVDLMHLTQSYLKQVLLLQIRNALETMKHMTIRSRRTISFPRDESVAYLKDLVR